MQGVPEQFSDEKDSAQFRHLPQLPGVELYHAHIAKYAFEPHTHEAFGIGAITWGAERFRYRGEQLVAPTDSLVLMNPDELHTGEAASEDGWQYRMIYLDPNFLESLTGERSWWFNAAVNHDPVRARQVSQFIAGLWPGRGYAHSTGTAAESRRGVSPLCPPSSGDPRGGKPLRPRSRIPLR